MGWKFKKKDLFLTEWLIETNFSSESETKSESESVSSESER